MGTILGFHGFLSLSIRNYKLALAQDVSFYPAFDALKHSRCLQLLLGPNHKSFSPEVEKFAALKDGIIEIGIGIVSSSLDGDSSTLQALKRSVDTVIKDDLLDSRLFAERRFQISFSDMKKVTNKRKS